MSTYFQGKRVAITGAGDGMGRELAIQLNAQGCDLWLCDISEERLQETHALLNEDDGAVHLAVVDCGDKDAIDGWALHVADATTSIDALFNNAGVGYAARFEHATEENYQWLMNVNFWGVVWGSRAFLPLLTKAPVGHLVNLSSIFGMIGVPTQSAYNAAKFAVRGFSESLVAEYHGTSIRVSCVHPGGIATNIARRARADSDQPSTTPDERDRQFKQHTPTTPKQAASIILKGVSRSKPQIMVGNDAKFMQWVSRLFPVGYHTFLRKFLDIELV